MGGKPRDACRREQDLLVQVRRRIARDSDVVQIFETDAGCIQTVANRLFGKAGGMFEAIETLLLGRSDEPAITHNGGGSVTVIRINPQNIHPSSSALIRAPD